MLARTDSAFLAVLAFVVSFVPAVFGSALLGGLADRLPRKVVLIGCDLARAVVIGVLALVAVDGTPVWVLLGLLLVAETFTAPFEAAHRAVVPDVLPDPRECLAGTGLMRMLYQVDQVVGIARGRCGDRAGRRAGRPAPRRGHASCVSATVLALTLRWRPASRDRSARTHAAGGLPGRLAAGVRQPVAARPRAARRGAPRCSSIAPEAVALAYARDDGAGPAVGAALMATPAGRCGDRGLAGRAAWTRCGRCARSSCWPWPPACRCWPTSLAPPWQVVMPLWFLSGVAQGFMVPLMTTVNLVTPPAMRGRVNGLAGAGFSTVTAATFLLSGAVADLATPAVAVTVAAVVALALVGVAHRGWPHAELRRTAERVYRVDA